MTEQQPDAVTRDGADGAVSRTPSHAGASRGMEEPAPCAPPAPRDAAGELAAAYVAALGELADIARGRTATVEAREGRRGYAYQFASLDDVTSAVRPTLAKHHLAVRSDVEVGAAGPSAPVAVRVETVIEHTSGAERRSPAMTMFSPADVQRVGSTITYLRRYSLLAMLGLAAAGEDDDGAAAAATAPATQSAPRQRRPSASRKPAPTPSPRTEAEAEIRRMIEAVTPEVRQRVRSAFRKQFGHSLAELDPRLHDDALGFVAARLDDDRADANTAEPGDPVTPESEDER